MENIIFMYVMFSENSTEKKMLFISISYYAIYPLGSLILENPF